MEVLKKFVVNIVFAVQVLLLFLLVFGQQLNLPSWLQAFGRLHPMLLHLPIGFLILTGILIITRKYFESDSFDLLISFLLHLAAITTSLTALMGLFLSQEGGYAAVDLQWHKWLGAILSFLCSILLIVHSRGKVFYVLLSISLFVLLFTGHLGANLTHGENFVLGPLDQVEAKIRVINDSSTLFEAAVDPLLESKCYSCHNERKSKGGLVLTSLDKILKGGKDGALWEAGHSQNSLLIKRLLLPVDDKEHMPPKDKTQLTTDEINFLSAWIDGGVDVRKRLKDYPEEDSLKRLSQQIMKQYLRNDEPSSIYHFGFVSPEKIASLSNPYRTVFQLALNEPALQADFFVRQAFQIKSLEELSTIKEQLVVINLSKMPIGDSDVKLLQQFKNLEVLNLNNTDITNAAIPHLKTIASLKSLSLSGTKINASSLRELSAMPNLKKVFVWNTGISKNEIAELRKTFPAIDWEVGYIPDAKEVLQLSQPLLENENRVLDPGETIRLKASLPGTTIRYTLNEKIPDSTSIIYDKPIEVYGYTVVTARAFKERWIESESIEFIFFTKGFKPSRAELLTPADEKYVGEGVTTLVDNKKGIPDFFKDPTWIAFRNNSLEAVFYFDNQPKISSLTISYSKNVGAMTMPPELVEVWGGEDLQHLKLLSRVTPTQPKEYGASRTEGLVISIPPGTFKCYKLIAKPLAKLPAFRKADPKDKGWLMVDEVFFN